MIDNGTPTVYGPTSGVNQYMSVSGHTLAYDANFNLSGYDAWSYVYDAEKRLISASGSGTAMGQGHSAQFVYDGLGRCVKRTIDNVSTLITYDGWKPIAEWDGAGGLVAWNLYGPGADEILVRYEANSYRYYHLDAHGHVRFLLNGNGEVIEKYSYDAFGHPKIMDGNGGETTTTSYGNRFLFTGREYLSALGLYDYRHRVYHPALGRFLQIDPLGLQIEGAKLSAQQTALFPAGTAPKIFSSSELNLYRYCHNDPVNKSDPTGLYFSADKSNYKEVEAAWKYSSKDPATKAAIDAIARSPTEVYVRDNKSLDRNKTVTERVTNTRTGKVSYRINWNSRAASSFKGGTQSPAMVLVHEIHHAERDLRDWNGAKLDLQRGAPGFGNVEERRVILGPETNAARKLGEGVRNNGNSAFFEVDGVTDR